MAEDRKGFDISIIEVGQFMPLADYFVLVSCTSLPHIKAMTQEITKSIKDNSLPLPKVEGGTGGWWILLDLGSVVVHLFEEKARSYYDFDNLWADAKAIEY